MPLGRSSHKEKRRTQQVYHAYVYLFYPSALCVKSSIKMVTKISAPQFPFFEGAIVAGLFVSLNQWKSVSKVLLLPLKKNISNVSLFVHTVF